MPHREVGHRGISTCGGAANSHRAARARRAERTAASGRGNGLPDVGQDMGVGARVRQSLGKVRPISIFSRCTAVLGVLAVLDLSQNRCACFFFNLWFPAVGDDV